ncbi:MAG: ATP-grasp domain-containing protein [candidate division KSB1 bacterium]|nr:ATP-grasp domain-containing protein [candidate division KSB1 bacterium]
MRRILLLGTAPPQADAAKVFKEKGCYVIGCSCRHQGNALKYLDRFELIDIVDIDALIRLAQNERIDLIYSIGSDIGVRSAAYVSAALEKPSFIGPDIIDAAANKITLRRLLENAGLNSVRFQSIDSEADLDKWRLYPAIVKPADSQGQRGVRRVESRAEAKQAVLTARHYSPTGQVIIEEFVEGPEISANVWVDIGVVEFCQITDRLVFSDLPCGIPRAHVSPSRTCKGALAAATRQLIEKTVKALGITAGPVYFQIKLAADGPKIIEVTPRLDGCHLWRLIERTTGVNLLEASLNALLDQPKGNLKGRDLGSANLTFMTALPNTRFDPSHYSVPPESAYHEFYYEQGETVVAVNGVLEKVGYYIEVSG